MDPIDSILERDWNKATQRGMATLEAGPTALAAHYDPSTGKLVVELSNGVDLSIPYTLLEGLENASPTDLGDVDIEASGLGIHFPLLNADLYVPALAKGVLGTKAWMRKIGQKGGASRSAAKAEAARHNGRLGGRPRRKDARAL